MSNRIYDHIEKKSHDQEGFIQKMPRTQNISTDIQHYVEACANARRKNKPIRGIRIRKKINHSCFADDIGKRRESMIRLTQTVE